MKVWSLSEEFPEGKFMVVRRDGTTPDWPHFVMGARDPAVPVALEAYAAEARRLGMESAYCDSVNTLADLFRTYRESHGDGDPEAPPHRLDDHRVLAMMRREISLQEVLFAATDLMNAERLLEMAEHQHANCDECEGQEVPEICAECFPFFDAARIARRNAIDRAKRVLDR